MQFLSSWIVFHLLKSDAADFTPSVSFELVSTFVHVILLVITEHLLHVSHQARIHPHYYSYYPFVCGGTEMGTLESHLARTQTLTLATAECPKPLSLVLFSFLLQRGNAQNLISVNVLTNPKAISFFPSFFFPPSLPSSLPSLSFVPFSVCSQTYVTLMAVEILTQDAGEAIAGICTRRQLRILLLLINRNATNNHFWGG